MPYDYPIPHPADVHSPMNRGKWISAGRPIPSLDKFAAFQKGGGRDGSPEAYAKWDPEAERVKALNARGGTKGRALKVDTPDAVDEKPPVAAAPSSPFTDLPHRRSRDDAPALETLSARVKAGINKRLDRYRIEFGVPKQDVVSDVLDAFLTFKGY